MQKVIHMKVESVSGISNWINKKIIRQAAEYLIQIVSSFNLDSEESPYQIYGRMAMPARGYIAPPRMYVGDWDWAESSWN